MTEHHRKAFMAAAERVFDELTRNGVPDRIQLSAFDCKDVDRKGAQSALISMREGV